MGAGRVRDCAVDRAGTAVEFAAPRKAKPVGTLRRTRPRGGLSLVGNLATASNPRASRASRTSARSACRDRANRAPYAGGAQALAVRGGDGARLRRSAVSGLLVFLRRRLDWSRRRRGNFSGFVRAFPCVLRAKGHSADRRVWAGHVGRRARSPFAASCDRNPRCGRPHDRRTARAPIAKCPRRNGRDSTSGVDRSGCAARACGRSRVAVHPTLEDSHEKGARSR